MSNIQIYQVNNGFIVRNVCPQEFHSVSNPSGTWVFNDIKALVKGLPDILEPKPVKPPVCGK